MSGDQVNGDERAERRAQRRRRQVDGLSRTVLGIAGFAIVATIWHLIAVNGWFTNVKVPTPKGTFDNTWDGLRNRDLGLDWWISVRRVLIGLAIGIGAAVIVGFLLGWYQVLARLFNPVISFFRALPPIALIPLVIIYLGIEEDARLSVLVYASFFSGVIVIYEGIRGLDPIYMRASKALGAGQFEMFRRVVLPLSLPTILVAIRVALGISWATLVAAELVAAQRGLGAVMSEAQSFFQVDDIYSGIVLIGLSAVIMDLVLQAVTSRVLAWREEVR